MNINYREDIAKSLFVQGNFKPLDLEFVLVQQLFDTCSEVTNPILSVTVSDIVYIYNQLVTNSEQICLNNFAADPLRIFIQELGGGQIKLQLPKEALRLRINLQLACRFLYNHKEIVKCPDCHAPVVEEMIHADNFRESLHGKSWRCHNKTCNKPNMPGNFQCINCNLAMPSEYFGTHMIFKKFKPVQVSREVKLLKYALKNLPILEDNMEMLSTIESELSKMA